MLIHCVKYLSLVQVDINLILKKEYYIATANLNIKEIFGDNPSPVDGQRSVMKWKNDVLVEMEYAGLDPSFLACVTVMFKT